MVSRDVKGRGVTLTHSLKSDHPSVHFKPPEQRDVSERPNQKFDPFPAHVTKAHVYRVLLPSYYYITNVFCFCFLLLEFGRVSSEYWSAARRPLYSV